MNLFINPNYTDPNIYREVVPFVAGTRAAPFQATNPPPKDWLGWLCIRYLFPVSQLASSTSFPRMSFLQRPSRQVVGQEETRVIASAEGLAWLGLAWLDLACLLACLLIWLTSAPGLRLARMGRGPPTTHCSSGDIICFVYPTRWQKQPSEGGHQTPKAQLMSREDNLTLTPDWRRRWCNAMKCWAKCATAATQLPCIAHQVFCRPLLKLKSLKTPMDME